MEVECGKLLIPAGGDDALIVVPLDNLPEDYDEITEILGAELAPISVWLDVAKAYLQGGRVDQYLAILRTVTGELVLQHYGDTAKFGRIQAHCALAQYHITIARTENDMNRRNQLLNDAYKEITRAQNEDPDDQLVSLAVALLETVKNNKDLAGMALVKAKRKTCNGKVNVASDVALAQFHFQHEKYDAALKCYVGAFRAHPNGPMSIRLGIAACHFKLHNFEVAQAAYERVCQLDPDNPEALAGLAALQLASPNPVASVPSAIAKLQVSFSRDPSSAPVLNSLALCTLIRGDFVSSIDFSQKAIECADTQEMQGISYCSLGRAYHATGALEKAHAAYAQATRLNPKSQRGNLGHYGLAQMLLQQREIKNGITELETVLDQASNNLDALMLLGRLYPHMPTKAAKRVARVKDASRKHLGNADIQELLGEVLAPSEHLKALESYKAAIQLHETRILEETKAAERLGDAAPAVAPIPPRLMNNAAVLYYRACQAERSRECVLQAIATLKTTECPDMPDSAITTLKYNLARFQEACGDSKSAQAGYEATLEEHPQYIDCYLRLSSIARQRGHFRQAEDLATKAMQIEGGHEDALAVMALNRLKAKDFSKAKGYLDKLLKGSDGKLGVSNDLYGNVLIANLHLTSAPADRPPGSSVNKEHLQKQLQHWQSAGKYYKAALALDPGNIYAANGLGAVCAEMGQLEPARQIFSTLRESAALAGGSLQVPDVWVNLGAIYLASGQPAEAARMFTTALAKFYNNKDKTVLLYLARAQYDQQNMHAAKRTLLKAIHILPTDHQLLFDVALTMQSYACALLNKKRDKGDPNKLDEIASAKIELTQASQFFDRLRALGDKRTGIPPDKLRSHVSFCKDTLRKAEKHLRQALDEQNALEAHRVAQSAQLEMTVKAQKLAQLMQQEVVELQKIERQDRAKAAMDKEKMLQEKWRHADAMNKATKSGDGSQADRAIKAKKRKEAEQAQNMEAAMFDAAEDSDDEEYDAGEDEAAAEAAEAALRQNGKYDSDDETGTAGGEPWAEKERSRLKRKSREPEEETLAGTGLESDGDSDGEAGLLDDETGDNEGDPKPKKARGAVLDDSDDD